MKTTSAALLCGAIMANLTWTPRAQAANPADQAAAEVLFNDAKRLAAAGDFARACPKFVESQRLDPTVGTLLNIGNCYEELDKLASAWGAFKQAEMEARGAGDTKRQAEAARRAAALSPKLAKLAIVVPPATRSPGFEVLRDGGLVGEGQWGSAIPVDVGRHTIEARAPGRKPWSTTVRIDVDGSSASIDVPILEMMPADTSAGGQAPAFWNGQRIAGLVVGGVGIVGLGMAGGFAASAAARNAESKQSCSPADPNFCNDVGVLLRKDARTAADVSTAMTVVGAAALVGGVVLFATASPAKPVEASRTEVVVRLGGLGVRGRF